MVGGGPTLCLHLEILSLLLSFDPVVGTLRLHDVVRTFLRQRLRAAELASRQRSFLAVLHLGLRHWAEVPLREGYLWQHLLWHLSEARQWGGIEATVLDLRWCVAKALVRGVAELEADFALLTKASEARTWATEALRLLRRVSHHLSMQGREFS